MLPGNRYLEVGVGGRRAVALHVDEPGRRVVLAHAQRAPQRLAQYARLCVAHLRAQVRAPHDSTQQHARAGPAAQPVRHDTAAGRLHPGQAEQRAAACKQHCAAAAPLTS